MRLAVWRKRRRRIVAGLERNPARHLLADDNAGVIARQVGKLNRGIGAGDDMAHPPTGKTVGEIVARQ